MNLREAKEYFKKHPCRDLNGRYYAYGVDGRVLGYVEYHEGVIVSRKNLGKRKR